MNQSLLNLYGANLGNLSSTIVVYRGVLIRSCLTWTDVLQAHLTQGGIFPETTTTSAASNGWNFPIQITCQQPPCPWCEKALKALRKMAPQLNHPKNVTSWAAFREQLQAKNLCCLVIGYKYFINGIKLTNMTNSYCYLILHLWWIWIPLVSVDFQHRYSNMISSQPQTVRSWYFFWWVVVVVVVVVAVVVVVVVVVVDVGCCCCRCCCCCCCCWCWLLLLVVVVLVVVVVVVIVGCCCWLLLLVLSTH